MSRYNTIADLTEIQASLSVKIAGSDPITGAETGYTNSSITGDLFVRDSINTAITNAAISVTTSAIEAKVGGSKLSNRKVVVITPTNGTVYWGGSNAVTTATGTPIFKNQSLTVTATDLVAVWLISAGTVNVRVVEAS